MVPLSNKVNQINKLIKGIPFLFGEEPSCEKGKEEKAKKKKKKLTSC